MAEADDLIGRSAGRSSHLYGSIQVRNRLLFEVTCKLLSVVGGEEPMETLIGLGLNQEAR